MFIQNKYTKWYFDIIEIAQKRNYGDENHHIIPKCLDGSDETNNFVLLTYREHYIVHYLLTKMNNSIKLKNALWQMSFKNKNKYFNSHIYEAARKDYIIRISGDNHWSKTTEFKNNLSKSWTKKRKDNFKKLVSGDNHWTKSKDMTEHSKLMRSFINKEEMSKQASERWKTNNPMFNPEISKKLKKPKETVKCPYCDKIGGKPVMMRYHFEKCKYRIMGSVDFK